MKHCFYIIFLGIVSVTISAQTNAQQHQHGNPPTAQKPIGHIAGIGSLHHPIWTTNPEAQRMFDQGLTLVYGFNHEEAIRSFRRAVELDPKAPMPWWGIAHALGPNYNLDVDMEREKAAHEAIQKANALSNAAPKNEQDYCQALAKRYSDADKPDFRQLALNYRDAMQNLAKQYPDDPDASVLFAESLMNLNPWQLWSLDGKPAQGTEEIVSTLEKVLKDHPDHVGANHYYIHAVEASKTPERALPSADRLGTMVPVAGHLVHMPAHIYLRTGDYNKSAAANMEAAKVDRNYLDSSGTSGTMYDLMYYSHNLHFLAMSCAMEGKSACTLDAVGKLVKHVAPGVDAMPMLEQFLPWPPFTMVRFGHWDDILKLPTPNKAQMIETGMWHYSRGIAFAAKDNGAEAQAERESLQKIIDTTPAEAQYGYNKALPILKLSAEVLDGKIKAAEGNWNGAVEHYRNAVAIEDQLNYDEPPDWYYPTRETLGAALIKSGNPIEAEKIFREDLNKNPRNGRSLFGLWKALEAQKKTTDAQWVKRQFDLAWKNADVQPLIEQM